MYPNSIKEIRQMAIDYYGVEGMWGEEFKFKGTKEEWIAGIDKALEEDSQYQRMLRDEKMMDLGYSMTKEERK
jgi:hypothetical protein